MKFIKVEKNTISELNIKVFNRTISEKLINKNEILKFIHKKLNKGKILLNNSDDNLNTMNISNSIKINNWFYYIIYYNLPINKNDDISWNIKFPHFNNNIYHQVLILKTKDKYFNVNMLFN